MKKIAILNCQYTALRCTGSGCMRAWSEKSGHFEPYKDQDVQLAAYMTCNGCKSEPTTDEGVIKKLDRLKDMGVETVHLGKCTIMGKTPEEKHLCGKIATITNMLGERGIKVVNGTH